MSAKPLPCPFCGMNRWRYEQTYLAIPVHTVECDNCGTVGPSIIPGEESDGTWTRADAIRAWNTTSGK